MFCCCLPAIAYSTTPTARGHRSLHRRRGPRNRGPCWGASRRRAFAGSTLAECPFDRVQHPHRNQSARAGAPTGSCSRGIRPAHTRRPALQTRGNKRPCCVPCCTPSPCMSSAFVFRVARNSACSRRRIRRGRSVDYTFHEGRKCCGKGHTLLFKLREDFINKHPITAWFDPPPQLVTIQFPSHIDFVRMLASTLSHDPYLSQHLSQHLSEPEANVCLQSQTRATLRKSNHSKVVFSDKTTVKTRQLSRQYASFRASEKMTSGESRTSEFTFENDAKLDIPVFVCSPDTSPPVLPVTQRSSTYRFALAPRIESDYPGLSSECFENTFLPAQAFVSKPLNSGYFTSQLIDDGVFKPAASRASNGPGTTNVMDVRTPELLHTALGVDVHHNKFSDVDRAAFTNRFQLPPMSLNDQRPNIVLLEPRVPKQLSHDATTSVLGKRRFSGTLCNFCKVNVYESSCYPTLVHDPFICGVLPLIVMWRFKRPEVPVELEVLLFDVEAQCSEFAGPLNEDFCMFWRSNYEEYLGVLVESKALGLDRSLLPYMSIYRNCYEFLKRV